MESGHRAVTKDWSFRDCVQDCARDERMVAAYNELYGTHLSGTVLALLEQPGADPQSAEGVELARFIFFCYETV